MQILGGPIQVTAIMDSTPCMESSLYILIGFKKLEGLRTASSATRTPPSGLCRAGPPPASEAPALFGCPRSGSSFCFRAEAAAPRALSLFTLSRSVWSADAEFFRGVICLTGSAFLPYVL